GPPGRLTAGTGARAGALRVQTRPPRRPGGDPGAAAPPAAPDLRTRGDRPLDVLVSGRRQADGGLLSRRGARRGMDGVVGNASGYVADDLQLGRDDGGVFMPLKRRVL